AEGNIWGGGGRYRSFAGLWDSINGERASWASNPWVWCVTFNQINPAHRAEKTERQMGTRADFYIGRGASAEWLGSIAWDGHPDSVAAAVLRATTEDKYRAALVKHMHERED